jgi:hypothetical protein
MGLHPAFSVGISLVTGAVIAVLQLEKRIPWACGLAVVVAMNLYGYLAGQSSEAQPLYSFRALQWLAPSYLLTFSILGFVRMMDEQRRTEGRPSASGESL